MGIAIKCDICGKLEEKESKIPAMINQCKTLLLLGTSFSDAEYGSRHKTSIDICSNCASYISGSIQKLQEVSGNEQ